MSTIEFINTEEEDFEEEEFVNEEEEFVNEEEKQELIIGFIRHVFEEVQTEGWKTRRDEFLIEQDLYLQSEEDPSRDIPDDMTFDKMIVERKGDVDEVISNYLYPILSSYEWIESWIYQLRPDMDQRDRGICYWNMWDDLHNFMYKISSKWDEKQKTIEFFKMINYDDVKEVLDLNVCLK
jgi:hypothetical protein